MKNTPHARRLERRRAASPHLALPPLPAERYDIAYVDPPWYYYGSPVKDAAAGKHYPLMSLDELAAIDLRRMLNRRAAAFIWATCPRLDFALRLIDAWGLHYRGVAYVWVKINKRGEIIAGQGVLPTFTKPTSELLLVATTHPTGRPFPILDLAQPQVVLQPRGAHSEKPAVFRTLIEELCGHRPRIELFARSRTRGWDVWGAEATDPPDR
ncbi:MAG TPA: MT-A70 family methyltransferase [Candidatus Dormibacteraeota bacterium]|nr:MT-A70 family methyltransferase [Candidatus Dormibacteraeota bacterium]